MNENADNSTQDESSNSGMGARIRKYRQDRNLSLNQLAESTGVSKGYLSALENEQTSTAKSRRPSAETLYAIAQALGVTMSDLLGRKLLTTATASPPPESLQKFAEADNLPQADIEMLNAIQFRGERPKTIERWRYIYTAIRVSESMDNH
ncbi:helix-turn-helix domain-containing protein [Amycolatopsis sp. NPDC004772]